MGNLYGDVNSLGSHSEVWAGLFSSVVSLLTISHVPKHPFRATTAFLFLRAFHILLEVAFRALTASRRGFDTSLSSFDEPPVVLPAHLTIFFNMPTRVSLPSLRRQQIIGLCSVAPQCRRSFDTIL